MKCATINCKGGAVLRVFWPGQTRYMCATCAVKLANLASHMGFNLKVEALLVADPRGMCPGCGKPALDGHRTCGDILCREEGDLL